MSRWYIIHAYSGFENKVRDAIVSEALRLGNDSVADVVLEARISVDDVTARHVDT